MKYRKKTPVVEAYQWFKNGDHPDDGDPLKEGKVVRRFNSPIEPGIKLCWMCMKENHEHGWIDSTEGGHRVCPGNYIIKGVHGGYFPCRSDAFREKYESVDDA